MRRAFLSAFWLAAAIAAPAQAAMPVGRWTAATPNRMLELAMARARTDGGLAGLLVAYTLADRADAGVARTALTDFAKAKGELSEQARWLAAELDPKERRPPGLLTGFSVLGPFQDSGGGLARHEGPEQPGQKWGDPKASYDWGAYEIRWRAVPGEVVSARGVPLDLLIHPRKESCSYLASRVSVRARQSVVFSVAATGAVRAMWDTVDAGSNEEVHEGALVDRLAFRVDATAGDHLLAVKVCSGAPDDQGRVRVRASDGNGSDIDLPSSAPQSFSPPPVGPAPKQIATAFARAIETGEHPAPLQALRAAIVRSLGKADDLRSPRASGLLDKVATDRRATPDAIALSGWISPFGAVRSGFLNLAIERSRSEGDSDTLSFSLRRIAVARALAKWSDWAMAALSSPPLSSAHDAEAEVIRAMVRGGLGIESLRRSALDDLLRVAAREGDKGSAAMWDQIATLSKRLDPVVHRQAKMRLASLLPEARDGAWVEAMTSKGGAQAAEAADEAWATGGIVSDLSLIEIAGTLRSAGRDDDARRFYEKAGALCPNRAAALHGLAESLFLGHRDADAARALARAHALDPASTQDRAETELRSNGASAKAPSDAAYLVEPSVLLAQKHLAPARRGEVADRQLYWVRVVTLHDDRRVSQLIQYAREVVIEPRTQEELYEPIPAEGDQTEIVRARVHRAAGGVAFAEEEKSEGGRPIIRWPDLKTGDVVEVVTRSWTSGPVGRRGDPPFYFIDYAGAVETHPLLFNEVVIDSPSDHPLAVDVLHGKPDRASERTEGGRKVVRLTWDRPLNVPDEPLAPKPSEILPTVVGSTFAGWKDFREWYGAAVEGFTDPDDQVRRLAASLTKGKRAREDKIRALFEYVADDIRYVNYVSGEWWLPNRPQQLLARRQGDCDDKAILLITLLKAVGIEATEVLLQTRYTAQPSILSSEKSAIPLFDHGIAYLPGPKGAPGQWLDATSPESRIGPLPAMDARARALFLSEGPPEMIATPPGRPDEHGVDGTWTIKLEPGGAGELVAVERHVGDHAFLLRTSLRERDARAQWVEQNLVAGWFPTVRVAKEVEFAAELARGAAEVRYRASSDGLARREGDELVVPLAPVSTLTSQLAPLLRRTLPVVLPVNTAPSHQTRTLRISPPPGFGMAELPPGGEEDGGEFGSARLSVRTDPKDPRSVLASRTVVFDMSTIPVEKYQAWRAWLQRVDALLHRAVRFVPKGAKP